MKRLELERDDAADGLFLSWQDSADLLARLEIRSVLASRRRWQKKGIPTNSDEGPPKSRHSIHDGVLGPKGRTKKGHSKRR